MNSCVVASKTVLKAIVSPPNNLVLLSEAEKAWYVYKAASTDSADDDAVLLPDNGIGRWFKCNNQATSINYLVNQPTASPTTVLDFANKETIQLVFSSDTAINFSPSLRTGSAYLILDRNNGTWNITGWDSRIVFTDTSYNFNTGINLAILRLLMFNNKIYVSSVREYV